MNSENAFLFIVLGLILIAFVVFLITNKNVKKYKSSKDIPSNLMLTHLQYSISEEKSGYSYTLSAHIVDGTVTVAKTNRLFAEASEAITSNTTSFDILYELEQIVEKNNLLSWKDLPISYEGSKDPYQRSIYLYFDNIYYSFSSNQALPDSSRFIFDQIERTILKYLDN